MCTLLAPPPIAIPPVLAAYELKPTANLPPAVTQFSPNATEYGLAVQASPSAIAYGPSTLQEAFLTFREFKAIVVPSSLILLLTKVLLPVPLFLGTTLSDKD